VTAAAVLSPAAGAAPPELDDPPHAAREATIAPTSITDKSFFFIDTSFFFCSKTENAHSFVHSDGLSNYFL
jgi:hypothetical protein